MLHKSVAVTNKDRLMAAFATTRIDAEILSCSSGVPTRSPDEFPTVHGTIVVLFGLIVDGDSGHFATGTSSIDNRVPATLSARSKVLMREP